MTYFGVNSLDGSYNTPSRLIPNSQNPKEDPEVELYVPNLPEYFINPPPPLQGFFGDHQTIPIYTVSPGTAPYHWSPPSPSYHEGQRQEERRSASAAPTLINSAEAHSDEQQDPKEEWFGNDEERKMASERYTKNHELINAILSDIKISYEPSSMKRVESLRNTVALLEKQLEKEREELKKTKEKCDSQMKEFKDNTARFHEQLASLSKPVSDEIYDAMVEKHYNELKKKLQLDPSGKLGPCCSDVQEEHRTIVQQSSFTVHHHAHPAQQQLQQDNDHQEGAAQLKWCHNSFMFRMKQKHLAEKKQLARPQHQMMMMMQPGHSVQNAPSHRWKSGYVPNVSVAAAGGSSPSHPEPISTGIELPSNFPPHLHVKKVGPDNRLWSGGGVVEVVLPPKPSPLGKNWTRIGGRQRNDGETHGQAGPETTSSNSVRSSAPTLVSLLEAPCLNPTAGNVVLYSALTGGEVGGQGNYQEGEHEHLNEGPAAGDGGDGEI